MTEDEYRRFALDVGNTILSFATMLSDDDPRILIAALGIALGEAYARHGSPDEFVKESLAVLANGVKQRRDELRMSLQ